MKPVALTYEPILHEHLARPFGEVVIAFVMPVEEQVRKEPLRSDLTQETSGDSFHHGVLLRAALLDFFLLAYIVFPLMRADQ